MALSMTSDLRAFVRGWLRAPFKVGAVVPSGAALARNMALQVDPARHRRVVELGPGTGAVTKALLARGVPPGNLFIIERDAAFCHLLHQRFPGVRIIHEDARHMGRALSARGIYHVDAVVSSLPLLSLRTDIQEAILREGFELLGEAGLLIQYTYGPRSPVRRSTLRHLGITGEAVARIWLNMPPATVWRYRAHSDAFTLRTSLAA